MVQNGQQAVTHHSAKPDHVDPSATGQSAARFDVELTGEHDGVAAVL
jgi:hypothetical protein